MDGNESNQNQHLMQFLEHVKSADDMYGSPTMSMASGLSNQGPSAQFSTNYSDEGRLVDLQRKAMAIQDALARLPKPPPPPSEAAVSVASVFSNASGSIARPHEIYQNLGPLMGAGLRNPPALPPKNAGRKALILDRI